MIIGNKELRVPILQGGMGIGISLGGLAGSVAHEGAMGCISTAMPGYQELGCENDAESANLMALRREIRKAQALRDGRDPDSAETAQTVSGKSGGLIAINAMVVTRQYRASIRAAVEEGIDAVISGAGLPLELPEIVGDSDVLIAPIVSSGRAADLILRTWKKRYNRTADFIVIEGCEAGGHLGFTREELENGTCRTLDEILPEVLEKVRPYAAQYGHPIPVFVAGGVFDGKDAAHFEALGAAGVQIATRFIATPECDASQGYKDVILKAKGEDARIIKSPVGLPGRAICTPLIEKVSAGERIKPKHCYGCITTCRPAETPYCISRALAEAARGNLEEGLFFCGSNVGRINSMMTVHELITEIRDAWQEKREKK